MTHRWGAVAYRPCTRVSTDDGGETMSTQMCSLLRQAAPGLPGEVDAFAAATNMLLSLTPTQRRVAELIACGLTDKQIGRHMHVAEATVHQHCKAITARLGLRRTTVAAVAYLAHVHACYHCQAPRSADDQDTPGTDLVRSIHRRRVESKGQ
jgi:DNA-binding CsgD family transcriptional regulator